MMDDISFFVALGAGLLSFLSPCVLPLIPIYLASLSGPEIFESNVNRFHMPRFLHSLAFVVGFSVIFIIMGAAAGLVGFVIGPYLKITRLIAGSLLIVFGLLMLAALKVPWLNYERRLNPSMSNTTGYLRSFLIGAVFPVAWIPCTSWVLGGILILAGTSATAWRGASLLAFYSLGVGLPFLIVGLAFDLITPVLRFINRYSNWIYIISGLLLIVVGVLILTNNLNWLLTVF